MRLIAARCASSAKRARSNLEPETTPEGEGADFRRRRFNRFITAEPVAELSLFLIVPEFDFALLEPKRAPTEERKNEKIDDAEYHRLVETGDDCPGRGERGEECGVFDDIVRCE
jgi:hypothetical protein